MQNTLLLTLAGHAFLWLYTWSTYNCTYGHSFGIEKVESQLYDTLTAAFDKLMRQEASQEYLLPSTSLEPRRWIVLTAPMREVLQCR